MKTTTFVSLCALLLAGCAGVTLDAEGCRNADWYEVGRKDGLAGRNAELPKHAAQCAAYGSKPDDAKYASGLAEGRADHATVMAPRRVSMF